ncbi:MAG: ribulose-phosphate 3-epimerase [Rickettsiales bacterium]|jgi:ribulose-phosphate 3-epimerase|nr:ribulose-phosphate 3-epimerase [Rickettsiales bacterium]
MTGKNASVALSILSSDYFEIKRTVAMLNESPADALHFDVMDGVFVKNITYGAGFVASLRPHSRKFFDVHLMIADPLPYVRDFAKAGADAITLHVESRNFARAFDLLKSLGVKAGVSLNPKTPFAKVRKYLGAADMVMVMTVEPGFGGQKFMEGQLDKVRQAAEWARKAGRDLTIQVDGGIDFRTAKLLIANGANSLVSGSFLLKQKDFGKAVMKLKSA